jgi:hypothetical protein
MATKECFRCHEVLPLSAFYRHPKMADGHLGKCKECTKSDSRTTYHRKIQDSAWAEQERQRNRERMRLQSEGPNWVSPLAPEAVKRKARNALANAIRDGRVKRPTRCGDCGNESRRIHGHHLDYFVPLHVAWVCPPCHRKRHALHPHRCTAHLKQSA